MIIVKVVVDAELCIGAGLCTDICPEVFDVQDDVTVVLVDLIPSEHKEAVREAAEACPTEAIIVEGG